MPKLDSSLAIGRATYERWLGTEPDEIAAAEALRRFEPEHPSLAHLEVRSAALYRSRRCSQKFFVQSWRRRMMRSGGGYSRASRRAETSPTGPIPAGASFVQVSSDPLSQRFLGLFLPFRD